ncbi:MAG: hypothetical protein M3546_04895 [Actinomycetota bacterium]|nr:hypothetical protein [Actinomycetota bacterium]
MRHQLLKTYDRMDIVDLHGDADRREVTPSGERDENVFEIKRGVAILFARKLLEPQGRQSDVTRADYLGSRSYKYSVLRRNTLSATPRIEITPRPDRYQLVLLDSAREDEYENGISVSALFRLRATGIETGKDAVLVAFSKEELKARMEDFGNLAASDSQIRERYGVEAGCGRKIADLRRTILSDPEFDSRIRPFTFAPFDERFVLYRTDLLNVHSDSVSRHLLDGGNLAFLAMRQVSISRGFSHVFVTRNVTNNRAFYSTRGKVYMMPLAVCAGGGVLTAAASESNLDEPLARRLSSIDGIEDAGRLSDEDLLAFTYAQMHSSAYRTRYNLPLRGDYPHVFPARTVELQRSLCRLGWQLITLHLLERPGGGPGSLARASESVLRVDKVRFEAGEVLLDSSGAAGFENVPEEVWNFEIGGYQVCHKWLKDRKGRTLSEDDIAHYQMIIVALSETIRFMQEIDEVIDEYGGWPGAFVTAEKENA